MTASIPSMAAETPYLRIRVEVRWKPLALALAIALVTSIWLTCFLRADEQYLPLDGDMSTPHKEKISARGSTKCHHAG